MTIPTEVQSRIDQHLQAVRGHLSDKDEAVQHEILEGLRDHIKEALTRGGEPITLESVETVLAAMDDPASYADEPALALSATARRPGPMTGNKWFYVALAFLAINGIGVWKIIQIERRTSNGLNGDSTQGANQVVVPHVPSNNKAGIRYPETTGSTAPAKTNSGTPSATPEDNTFRSIAFLQNQNPVLQKSDQALSWLFNTDVVDADTVGKPATQTPLKVQPEVPGTFTWESARQLTFQPETPWQLDQSFTAEWNADFKAADGKTFEGSRFWRFSTADFALEKITQIEKPGAFQFRMTFSLPTQAESLQEKLKLSYLNANGEKRPLDFTTQLDAAGTTATLTTPIVPAISFECEIAAGLQPQHWSHGTRTTITHKLPNSRILSLSAASLEAKQGEKPAVTLVFSDTPSADLARFLEISPKVDVAISQGTGRPNSLRLSGDFAAGIAYEIKVKSGMTSQSGCVLPFHTTRNLALSQTNGSPFTGPGSLPPFELTAFTAGRQSVLESGNQELRWKFSSPVVAKEMVGQNLTHPPIELSPPVAGSFYWVSPLELAFKPNMEWELNRFFEARLTNRFINFAGTVYSGPRFWSFSSPAMSLLSATHLGSSDGFRFGLQFSMTPASGTLEKHLKVFCYDSSGKRIDLAYSVHNPYADSPSKQIDIQNAPTYRVFFEMMPGFQPANWSRGITEKIEVPAVVSTVLRVNSVNQSGGSEKTPSIRIQLSENVDVKTAAAFIEITPAVKFTVQRDNDRNNTLRLFGPFVANRDYEVKIKAGMVSEKGFVLVDETTETVTISRAASSLGFAGAGGYLSPTGSLLVPITFQNLAKCKVSVAPVMSNNLVYFARNNSDGSSFRLPSDPNDEPNSSDGDDYDEYNYYGGRSITDLIGNVTHKDMPLSGALNQESTDYLKLRDYAKTKGAYLVQIHAQDPENENYYQRRLSSSRLVVITDLGISAKRSKSHVFVWVCSLKDAKPASGVEVTAYSANNQRIAKATTNADGIAAIPCDDSDKNSTPFLVTAQLADDLSYLRLDDNQLQGDLTESTRDYRSTGAEAFLFTDRGIFRPGEPLHAKTILRNPDFSTPAAFPVVFQIIKPDGRLFKEIAAMPNSFGTAELNTVMPEYLPTGRYTLRLRVPQAKEDLGSTTFLVEDFVPPQIRVTVSTDRERVPSTEVIKADIFAEHLFGAPAAGLKADIKCIYSPVSFAPKQWSEYEFGIRNMSYWGDRERSSFSMSTQDMENLTLDEEGKTTVEITSKVPSNAPGPIQALLQATVFEQSGRAVTATKKAVIDPYPFYIGLKTGNESWLKSGTSQKIPVIAVTPDGTAFQPAKPLVVKLSRIDWNYNYKRGPDGTYTYETHKVVTLLKEESLDLTSGAADYSFTPTGYGYNVLSFTDPDSGSTSSFSFYASDYAQSWSTSERDQPESLTLKLDKPEYQIGDTAKLTVQAPFSGTALLTMESDKVLQSRVIFLEKNTAEVDVEVKDIYAPNIHCTVSVIRPSVAESVWKGHRGFGSIPLKVSPRRHKMNVALETPATILPQSKLTTKIRITDDAGQPVDGEVTLIAVDEAICMLTSFKTPSPLSWLYEMRRLGVQSHDVYSELMEVLDESVLTKKSNPGGGDDGDMGDAAERLTKRLNPIKANRFKPVALWASNITVTNGTADVDLNIPEFTGELRIMAVACNTRLMGSAQGMVKVKRPLIVQPSLPRFLAPGDECQMDVTVFNETGKDVSAQLQITCGGPLSTKISEQVIALKKGGSASVSIPVVAGNLPGKGLCTIRCEADGILYNDTIEIAVRPPISAEVLADSGFLAPGKTIEMRAPANWLPESVRRTLHVSKEPSLELGHGLQYLMRYPYGCLEQTTSASFPLLYLPDLAQRTFDKSMNKDATKEFVMTGIWRILSMQQANGGFTYWPSYNYYSLWSSSYATHFLVEAKKAGYEVPKEPLQRALKALREGLDSSTETNESYGNIYDLRAYACYVLAVAGEPEHSWQSRMLEMKDKLSYYARLMNASALLVQGEPKRAVPLLKELGLPSPGPRDQGGCFHSPNRNAALLLSAWLDIDPNQEDVGKLVYNLRNTKINGYWGTTQDNAMVLMALGKYSRMVKQESKEFKAMVTLPNGTSEVVDHTKDHTWVIERNETGAILLTNQGPGNLYYSMSSEGIPLDLPEYYKKLTAKNEGIRVQREWLDDKGNPVDISQLKQNDLVVAKITIEPNSSSYDNVAIEDLLPAGLEVENPNLDTTQALPWITEKSDWCTRRDIRDDRVLLFTKAFSQNSTFYYLARAVTPGSFVVPPVSAECMYDPEVRSVTSQAQMIIRK